MIRLSLFVILLAVSQASPSMDLAKVELVGAKRFSPADVIRLAGLTIGKTVTVAELNAAAQRLADSGFFERVRYRYALAGRRATVTFEIEESPWTIPVRFDNFIWFTPAQLTEAVRQDVPTFDGTVPKSREMPDLVTGALQRLLTAHRIPGRVEFLPEANLGGQILSYGFAVKDPAPTLCGLRITGVGAIPEADVHGALRQLVGAEFSHFTLNAILRGTLTDLYRRRGYWRAAFGAPAVALDQSETCAGVTVTIPVTEGVAYVWERAEWTGNIAATPADLDAALGLKPGEIADVSRIDDGVRAVRRVYGRLGYLQHRATYSPRLNDETRRAVFEFKVEEGPQFRMGTLQIVGLPEEDAANLREKWRLSPGDVYDDQYAREFQMKEVAPLGRARRSASGKPPSTRYDIDPVKRVVNIRIEFQ